MKRFFLFLFVSTISFIAGAQTPYVSWEHNFPLPALTMSLSLKNDNSILYTGRTSPSDSSCFGYHPLISIWQGELNSTKNSFSDFCFSMEDTTNSNGLKVIAESDTIYDIFGFTTDTSLFGAKNHSNQRTSDVFFMKVNSSGVVRFCKLYGSLGDEGFSSVEQTRDHGWIIGATSVDSGGDVPSHYGSTMLFPQEDDWVFKLDSVGNIRWSVVIGGTGHEVNPQVIQGNDGYYYMCSSSNSTDYDLSGVNPSIGGLFVVKIDSTGNKKLIGVNYGGYFASVNYNAALSQLKNNKLFFSGFSDSPSGGPCDDSTHGGWDMWVVELDTALNCIWHHLYGSPNEDEETMCADNMLMPDGSIVIAGEENSANGSNIYLIRIDSSDGHLIWTDTISGNGLTYVQDGAVIDNNDIMLCGYSNANTGIFGDSDGYHSFLIELSDITGIPPEPKLETYYDLSVYPNPLSESAIIKLDGGNHQHWKFILQDLLGREVAKYANDGQISLTISRNVLPAGLYIGLATNEEGQILGKTKIVIQ